MTRIKHYLLLLSVLLLSLTSCSKDEAYKEALPADATMVCTFDLKTLSEKAGLSSDKNNLLRQRITALMGDSYQDLFLNIKKSGIDLSSPIYLFATEQVELGYLLRLDDADKLEESFNQLRNLNGEDSTPLKEEDGIFIDIDEETSESEEMSFSDEGFATPTPPQTTKHLALYAFNDKAFISLNSSKATAEELKQLAKTYLTQQKEASYTSTAAFRDLEAQKGDIRGALSLQFFSTSGYAQLLPARFAQLASAATEGIDTKKCYMLYALSFETGEVVGTMTYGATEQAQLERLKKRAADLSPESIQDGLIKLLPRDGYLTAAMTLDAPKFVQYYGQLPFLQELKSKGVNLDAVAASLGKEITLSFFSIDVEHLDLGVIGYLKSRDASLVDAIYQQAATEGKPHIKEGEHRYRFADAPISYGYANGLTYVRSGKSGQIELGTSPSEDFTKHAVYSTLKTNNSFVYIDLKKLLTTSPTADLLQVLLSEQTKNTLLPLHSLSITSSGIESQLHLKLDTKENALKALIPIFTAL